MSGFVSPPWMPSSLREAATAGDASASDLESGAAWAHLLAKLQAASTTVLSDSVPRNPVDMAVGFRHLLVLLWIGIDDARRESSSVLAVRPSNTDAVFKWGMDCPDCLYTGAGLRGGDTYRLWGNRGTARYVGLQTMAGMASTANVLLDEIELAPNGDFEIVLSAEERPGNWLKIAEDADTARRSALLLRLGYRGRVVAVDRTAVGFATSCDVRRSRPAGRDGVPDRGARRFRRGESRLLLPVRAPRAPEHIQSTVRRHGDGRGGRKSSGDRVVAARAG